MTMTLGFLNTLDQSGSEQGVGQIGTGLPIEAERCQLGDVAAFLFLRRRIVDGACQPHNPAIVVNGITVQKFVQRGVYILQLLGSNDTFEVKVEMRSQVRFGPSNDNQCWREVVLL